MGVLLGGIGAAKSNAQNSPRQGLVNLVNRQGQAVVGCVRETAYGGSSVFVFADRFCSEGPIDVASRANGFTDRYNGSLFEGWIDWGSLGTFETVGSFDYIKPLGSMEVVY